MWNAKYLETQRTDFSKYSGFLDISILGHSKKIMKIGLIIFEGGDKKKNFWLPISSPILVPGSRIFFWAFRELGESLSF